MQLRMVSPFIAADSPRTRIMKYPILLKEVKKKVSHTVPQIDCRHWRAYLPISLHYLILMGWFSPSLVPRPFFEGRRDTGLVHFACSCARSSQKIWGNQMPIRIRLYMYIRAHVFSPAISYYSMEMPVHAPAMCARPFFLLP